MQINMHNLLFLHYIYFYTSDKLVILSINEFMNHKQIVLTTLLYICNLAYMNKWCMHKTRSLLWEEREGETMFPILFSKQAFVWNLHSKNFFWTVLKLLWNLTSRIKFGTKIRRTTSPSPFWNRNSWACICDWGLSFNTIENAKKKKRNIFNWNYKLYTE